MFEACGRIFFRDPEGSDPLLQQSSRNTGYIADCGHSFSGKKVTQLIKNERNELICSVCSAVIGEQFTVGEHMISYSLIVRNIENIKATRRLCAVGCCFTALIVAGFTYFQVRD